MAGIPIPRPSFLDDCEHLGHVHGDRRWRSFDRKRIYTWDSLHGEIEVFNKRGKHIAVYTPQGDFKKSAKNGRTIEV